MARSRFQRSGADLPPFRPTSRDDGILLTLHRLRYCLVGHVASLHFSSEKRASERLMVLYQHGWTGRLFLPAEKGQASVVHVLGEKGAARLRELGHDGAVSVRTRRRRSELFLGHELAVSTVLASLLSPGGAGVSVSCVERASDALADSFSAGGARHAVRPDGAACVDADDPPARAVVLIEADRGTMAARQMRAKFLAYREWLRSAPERAAAVMRSLLSRNGAPARPVRISTWVCVVAPDASRARRLARIAAGLGCPQLFRLAVEADIVEKGALGTIWVPAGELERSGKDASPGRLPWPP